MDSKNASIRRIAIFLILLGNLLLWLIPSDVAELIAREQAVLVNRYSGVHFGWNLAAGFFSLISIYLLSAAGPQQRRRRVFAIIAVAVVTVPVFLIVNIVMAFSMTY